jgi:hypothetical protein
VTEEAKMRGSGRVGKDATRELRNKATQTLITHVDVTESYVQDDCIKISIRAGDVAIWKQWGIATTLTTPSVSNLNTGKFTHIYGNQLPSTFSGVDNGERFSVFGAVLLRWNGIRSGRF